MIAIVYIEMDRHEPTNRHAKTGLTAALTIALVPACIAMAKAQDAPGYAAIIAAPDRTEADRQTDARRDPMKLLAFAGVRPGMKVLDMGAGGGYSAEFLARAVAPAAWFMAKTLPVSASARKPAFEARLKTPAGKNIVAIGAAVRRSSPGGSARSRSHYFSVFLPRYDVHER